MNGKASNFLINPIHNIYQDTLCIIFRIFYNNIKYYYIVHINYHLAQNITSRFISRHNMFYFNHYHKKIMDIININFNYLNNNKYYYMKHSRRNLGLYINNRSNDKLHMINFTNFHNNSNCIIYIKKFIRINMMLLNCIVNKYFMMYISHIKKSIIYIDQFNYLHIILTIHK